MEKNRVLLVLEIVLLLVFISSLVSCGGSRTSSPATPAATASHRLDTGPPGLPLYCPTYVTHDQQGNIYVTDSDKGYKGSHRARIVKLSPTGKVLAIWGKTGSAPGELSWPQGVAVDAQENVYVVDSYNSRIQKFSSTGTLLAVFGNTGSSVERLNLPTGIDLDPQGDVYIGDLRNHRLAKFSPEGQFLSAWSGAGGKQFSSARGVAVDRAGNIYITDARNLRIVKFSPAGKVLAIWQRPMDPAMFGITVDPQGNIYVAMTMNGGPRGGIRKLSPSGAVLATWPATCPP